MMNKKILQLMLDCETEEDYADSTEKAANYINTRTRSQMGEFTYAERLNRFQRWNEENKFGFSSFVEKNNETKWIVTHYMGKKWSRFQFATNKKLLRIPSLL